MLSRPSFKHTRPAASHRHSWPHSHLVTSVGIVVNPADFGFLPLFVSHGEYRGGMAWGVKRVPLSTLSRPARPFVSLLALPHRQNRGRAGEEEKIVHYSLAGPPVFSCSPSTRTPCFRGARLSIFLFAVSHPWGRPAPFCTSPCFAHTQHFQQASWRKNYLSCHCLYLNANPPSVYLTRNPRGRLFLRK